MSHKPKFSHIPVEWFSFCRKPDWQQCNRLCLSRLYFHISKFLIFLFVKKVYLEYQWHSSDTDAVARWSGSILNPLTGYWCHTGWITYPGTLGNTWNFPDFTIKAAKGTFCFDIVKFSPALIASESLYLNFAEYSLWTWGQQYAIVTNTYLAEYPFLFNSIFLVEGITFYERTIANITKLILSFSP